MDVKHCDICNGVIKRSIYIVSSLKTELIRRDGERYEMMSEVDFLKKLQTERKNLKIKEICCACHKIWIHLLKMRLKDLKKIKKEIDILSTLPTREPKKSTRKIIKKKNGEK